MAALPIIAHIAGRQAARDEVQAWELGRARKVARKLRIPDPPADLAELNRRIVDRKLELGHAGIELLLDRQLAVADRVGRVSAAVSRGRRRLCSVELSSETGVA